MMPRLTAPLVALVAAWAAARAHAFVPSSRGHGALTLPPTGHPHPHDRAATASPLTVARQERPPPSSEGRYGGRGRGRGPGRGEGRGGQFLADYHGPIVELQN